MRTPPRSPWRFLGVLALLALALTGFFIALIWLGAALFAVLALGG